MTYFCFANYRFRVYFAIYRFLFRFVSPITVSPPYESARKNKRLDDDIKAAEAWLYADAKRELWNIREVLRPSIQTQEASLICLIAAAFLHKSNSSAFSFLFHLHPTEYPSPTNSFSSSQVKFFDLFSPIFTTTSLILYTNERDFPFGFIFRAVISAPDHWTARTREWRSPCVERNNLPSVFPLSEFSNLSDLALLYSRWQPQSLDKYVHSY